jgi:GNAT superfamily N-acetyltransferase
MDDLTYRIIKTSKDITSPADREIYDKLIYLYDTAFPGEEVFPKEDLIDIAREGSGELIAFFTKNESGTGSADNSPGQEELAGGAYVVSDDNIVYGLFLAIIPELRNKGIGSGIINGFAEMYPGRILTLLIESPDEEGAPNAAERIRREGFYKRNGCDYAPFMTKEPGGEFYLMSKDGEVTFEQMREFFLREIGRDYLDKWKVEMLPRTL